MTWDPEQYDRFREERMAPLYDLLALIRPQAEMSIIDLGCGTGEVTQRLVNHLSFARALGIDSSAEMLARVPQDPRLSFRQQDISEFTAFEPYDLVFSNAALQWVPDNRRLLSRLLDGMHEGAQVAVQVPRNEGHVSHQVAHELAATPPFCHWLDGFVRQSHVLPAEEYAQILYQHGCSQPYVSERIYMHLLPHTADVVAWVKGTLLTPYLSRLDDAQQAEFLEAYRTRLLTRMGNESPCFYAFRRLLMWGRKRS